MKSMHAQDLTVQGDHNWTMKNPEVLADMRVTEETMMIFSNSLDPNETLCDTASHCDPCCLTMKNNGFREYFKMGKKSGEMVSLTVATFVYLDKETTLS